MRPTCLLPLLLLPLFAAPALAQAPEFDVFLTDDSFEDRDGSGDLTCGDRIHYLANVTAPRNESMLDTRFRLTLPSHARLDASSLNAINSSPSEPVVIHSGDRPGDTVIDVELGKICSSEECPNLLGGASVSWTVELVRPNSRTALSLQGDLTGSNFPPAVTDDPGTTTRDDPTRVTYPACAAGSVQVTATLTDSLQSDRDGDGLTDAGDTVRYTLQVRNSGSVIGSGGSLSVEPDAASRLIAGSVTTSRGTVAVGNGPGDSRVVVDLGSLDATTVTVTYDVLVDDPVPGSVSSLTTQGSVEGGNFAPVPTDDPELPGDADPTFTPLDFDPDLALAKDDGGASVTPGGTVAYTLTATNLSGRQGASDVTLTETVPAHTRFAAGASTPGWSCTPGPGAGSTCRLALGSLGAGASRASTFALRLDDPLPAGVIRIDNTASVADDGTAGPDPDPANNSAADSTPVSGAAPDLTLIKTADPASDPRPGGLVLFALAYSNQGNQAATGVTLTESVPAHTRFEPTASTPGWTCSPGPEAGSTCTLDLGDLPGGGGGGEATFAVRLDDPLPAGAAAIDNCADLEDDGGGGPPPSALQTRAQSCASVPVSGAVVDLTLGKDDGGAAAVPGETVVYTLTYANTGNRGASGVALTETVPAHTSFDAAASTPGWSCVPSAAAGSTCTLDLGSLAGGGASGSATFAVRVVDPLPAGVTRIDNTAAIADDGAGGPDADPQDNTASDDTPVDGASAFVDLTLDKDDGNAAAVPGETVAYTLSYANSGNRGASGVALTETVPVHTTFDAAASTPGWSCVPDPAAGSTCTLDLGILAGGASGSATFAVRVADPLPAGVTRIDNSAAIADDGAGGPDADPQDNTASDDTPVSGAAPDLTLGKSPDPASDPRPGGLLAWTLSYRNDGNQTATGVRLVETVPAHTTHAAGDSSPGWSCSPGPGAGSRCELPVGDLPGGGAGGEATFAVRIDRPLPAGAGSIDNCADLTDGAGSGDQACAPVQVTGAYPDLVLAKDDAGATVQPGELVAYRLTYRNTGIQGASGVVLTDTVPAHTTFEPAASTPGWSCVPDARPGSVCTLPLGEVPATVAGSTLFALRVDDPLPDGVTQVVNRASVADDGAGGTDPTPGDNLASETTPVERGPGEPPPPPGPEPEPDLSAFKEDRLTGDHAGDGLVHPGDGLTYVVTIQNLGDGPALAVVFATAVDPHTRLAGGSVTTTHGRVVLGIRPGDRTVQVDLGHLGAGEMAIVTFDVVVEDPLPEGVTEVACQGEITAANTPSRPTDDPDTLDPLDPTVTPVEPPLPAGIVDIPTLGTLGFLALALLLAGSGLVFLGRGRPRLAGLGIEGASREILRQEEELLRRPGPPGGGSATPPGPGRGER